MPATPERRLLAGGVRYTVRLLGPAPWTRPPPRWWQFWKRRNSAADVLAAEVVEFFGHPQTLRSRVTGVIALGTFASASDDELRERLRTALDRARFPHGNDMVALSRGEEEFVISWGEWNQMGALLGMCGYEMESSHRGPEITARDAAALHQVLSGSRLQSGGTGGFYPGHLPAGFLEFVRRGAFQLTDVG